MSKEDLIPFNKMEPEKARVIQKAGGIASGESKRRRKALREGMELLLDAPVADSKKLKLLKNFGFTGEDLNNSSLVVVALFKRAALGDVFAIKELRDIIGETQSQDIGSLEQLLAAFKNV